MKILNEIITFTEWLIDRRGIETNGMKKRREEHELLVRTSQNLTALQERYTENSIQINNLMIAQREILADKINEKYKYYISLNGIPEDEVEEFTNLHQAYKLNATPIIALPFLETETSVILEIAASFACIIFMLNSSDV